MRWLSTCTPEPSRVLLPRHAPIIQADDVQVVADERSPQRRRPVGDATTCSGVTASGFRGRCTVSRTRLGVAEVIHVLAITR